MRNSVKASDIIHAINDKMFSYALSLCRFLKFGIYIFSSKEDLWINMFFTIYSFGTYIFYYLKKNVLK